ncbi:hypothetical protein CAEBREN_32653 [Caenorhabditis brenneri]|uniref:Integrase catalytic domain-containing protein n=1 Tax=Caenorhabditis brenneri TaxID=135651 RepID=G0NDD3_CAEBE|nr:hypothetical protein CAEBREN_32653 [Caenorhabditis brenneri]
MSSLEEIANIEKLNSENQMIFTTNLGNSKNTTIFHNPTESNASKEGTPISEYCSKYAVKLRNEESRFSDQYERYKIAYQEGLEKLYNTPSGTTLSEQALKTAAKLENQDKTVREALDEYEKRIQARHQSLIQFAKETANETYEEHTFDIKFKGNSREKEMIQNRTRKGNQVSNVNNVVATPTTNLYKDNHMDLPLFCGDIAEWPAFSKIFDALVVKDTTKSDVWKHNILRRHLRGPPFELVLPYNTDGSDFQTALNRLEKIYNNSDRQYAYLWNKLMSLPQAKDTPQSLRSVHNKINAIIHSLRAHGDIEALNFQSLIKDKIPEAILREVLKAKPKNTTALLEALDDCITIEELTHRSHHKPEKEEKSIFSAKTSQTNQRNKQNKKNCRFCNKNNHSTHECRTVATLQKRRDYIQNHMLRFNCMNTGHASKDCTRPPCRKCNTRHNVAICPKRHNDNKSPHQKNDPKNGYQNQNKNQKQNYQQNNSYNSRNQSQNSQNDNKGKPQVEKQNQTRQGSQGQSNQNKNRVNNYHLNADNTSLMIGNAPILLNDQIDTIPVMFDSGADQSFILEEYAEKMNMKVIETGIEVDLTVFGQEKAPIKANKVEFEIITNSDNESPIKIQALTIPKITDIFDPIEFSKEEKQFMKQKNLKIINITKPETPVALIGCDKFWELVTMEENSKLPSGRFIISTHIGPIVCGKPDNEKLATNTHALIARIKQKKEEPPIETSLEQYFEINNIGITGEESDPTNEELMEDFLKNVKINPESNRIVVPLPWKNGQREKLANNKEVAFCRLRQLYSSSQKKNDWNHIIDIFVKMEENDIIEDVYNDPNVGYYHPYGIVYNKSSNTTKRRAVFDASSKKSGEISLNNALHQGPSFIPEIPGTLLRMRVGKYVMSSDIEKAFHAVEINENDRDALRFFWLKDPTKPPTNENLRIMKFKRLPFGVNCSPYLLSMAILYGIRQAGAPEEIIKAIEKMCYVDNLFILTDDKEKLPQMYTDIKYYFQKIGMNIREFSVNYPETFLKEEDKAKNLDNVKILGYLFDLNNDTLEVRKPELKYNENTNPIMSKQVLVSEITSIFDPLQYFAPLYYDGKQILRSVSDGTIKWKQLTSRESVSDTIRYLMKINESTLKFRRDIGIKINEPVEIAVFTDASENTYGACLYLKANDAENTGQYKIHLMIAKQRIAPKIKTLTIPRLELLGILIGTRLLEYTLKEMELNVTNITIYSDSTIALAQIKNHATSKGEKFPIFVENRCREIWRILQHIKTENNMISLSHVPTDQNPADHITRGCVSEKELYQTNWFTGPDWLKDNNHPDHPSKTKDNQLLVPTLKEEKIVATVHTHTKVKTKIEENRIFSLDRINDFSKTKRVAAIMLRFLKNRIHSKLSKEHQSALEYHIPELRSEVKSGQLTVDELIQGEKLLIRTHQITFGIKENAKKNQFVPRDKDNNPSDQIVYQYNRVMNSPKRPILHTRSELSRVIVKEFHEENLHSGLATTLGLILDYYAGVKWRALAKKVIKACKNCRKAHNHSFREAPAPKLPERRTNICKPFEHVGIDFMGPFLVQETSTSPLEKAYIAAITCATSRLTHLELVRNLSTDELLLALSRFMSRRGYPKTITSDNAATFKLTGKILSTCSEKEPDYLAELESDKIENQRDLIKKKLLDELQREMTKRGVKWIFNTALSPWQGGFFERIVGITKKALKHTFSNPKYITKDLETIMIECESLINRRPLTYVDEENDDYTCLRPIDIITPKQDFPIFDLEKLETEHGAYTELFRQTLLHTRRFWDIFTKDYLKQAKTFESVPQANRAYSKLLRPVVGEVVLLKNESTPREKWKIGIITELLKGRDGEIRSVKVKTTKRTKTRKDGSTSCTLPKHQEITRPLRLIIPLEIRPQNEEEMPDNGALVEKISNPEINIVSNKNDLVKSDALAPGDKPDTTVSSDNTSPEPKKKRGRPRKVHCHSIQNRTVTENQNNKKQVFQLGRKPKAWQYLTIALALCTVASAASPADNRLGGAAAPFTKSTTVRQDTTTTLGTVPPTTVKKNTKKTTVSTTTDAPTTLETTLTSTIARPVTTTTTRRTTTTTVTTRPTTTSTQAPSTVTTTIVTRTTTEYYSPYTPQWRTPHTTQEWQYASTTPAPNPWTAWTHPSPTQWPQTTAYPTHSNHHTRPHEQNYWQHTTVSTRPYETTVPEYLRDYHDKLQRRIHGEFPRDSHRRQVSQQTPTTTVTTTEMATTTTTKPRKANPNKIPFHEEHDSKSRIECTKKGANLIDEESSTNLTNTVCVENWCDHDIVTKDYLTEVLIPPENTLHKYTVTWKKPVGKKFLIIEAICPATDYCWKSTKYFNCLFCTRFILNPQCHPKGTIALVVFLITVPLKMILCCFNFGKIWELICIICCCDRIRRRLNRNTNEDFEMIEMTPLARNRDERKARPSLGRWRNRLRRDRLVRRQKNIRNSTIERERNRTFEVRKVNVDGREVIKIEKTSSRSPSPRLSTVLTVVALFTVFTLITSVAADVCDSTHPITHDETTCTESGICRIEKIEDIFFTPETRTTCLQLVSKKNVISKFKLSVAHNYRKCQKGPILYTKNVTVHADSAKRCHGMGECVDRKCLDVGPNSKLSEFTEGNKYPGHTYCVSSCGGLWCKCLLPTEACLFYRTYAVPTTDEKFQIYSCEAWSNSINFQSTMTVANEEIEYVFLLREGEDYKIDYVYLKGERITVNIKLISITEETGLSILGKKFIQSNEKIALASISNEIFPLECTETGECNYRETCNCRTAEAEAICDCSVPDLYKILDDKHHNLPVISERYQLATGQDNVPTIKTKHNKLHVQITIEQSYHASVVESKVDCSITEPTPYSGCYNCLKGASQNITCTSKEPTHAKLSCDNSDFIDILTCDKNGVVNEIHRKFNDSTPTGVCTVVCGNKNNSYKIEGKLTYVSHTSLFEYLHQVFHSEKGIADIHPWHVPDFLNIINVIGKGLFSIVSSILTILLLSALVYFCCIPALIKCLGGSRY